MSIRIAHKFISKNIVNLSADINTVKEAYIQQIMYNPNYDYDGADLLSILRHDKKYLLEYIKYLFAQNERYMSYEAKNLSVVWLVEDIEDVLNVVFDFIAENENYTGILDHFCNYFFSEIKETENIKRSNKFIKDYICHNYTDVKKMNMITDVLRHTKNDLFEEAYIHFLELTQDIELYTQIRWCGSGGTGSMCKSVGEKMDIEWHNVLEITKKVDLGIKLIPIKKYIYDQIEGAMNYAEDEKRRRFLDRF
jgi:hypothetical protein